MNFNKDKTLQLILRSSPIGIRLLGSLSVFALLFICNRFEGAAFYGELVYIQITVGLIANIVLFGLGRKIINDINAVSVSYDDGKMNELIGIQCGVLLINFSILIALGGLFFTEFEKLDLNVLILLIGGIRSLRLYSNEIVRANKHYVFYALCIFVLESLILILLILFEVSREPLTLILISEVIIFSISFLVVISVIGFGFVRKIILAFNLSNLKDVYFSSASYFLVGVAIYFVAIIDQYTIKFLINDFAILGLYAAFLRVARLISLPLTALRVIWVNEISKCYNQKKNVFALFQKLQLHSLAITFITFLFVLIIKDSLFEFLDVGYSKEYFWIFFLMCIGFLFEGGFGPVAAILTFTENQKYTSIILLFMIPISLILNVTGVYLFGLFGAALLLMLIRFIQNYSLYAKARHIFLRGESL